jgi:hypothetical protein
MNPHFSNGDNVTKELLTHRTAFWDSQGMLFLELLDHRAILNQILEQFHWECLVHPSYRPDLAPCDFWLFRSLKKHIKGKYF